MKNLITILLLLFWTSGTLSTLLIFTDDSNRQAHGMVCTGLASQNQRELPEIYIIREEIQRKENERDEESSLKKDDSVRAQFVETKKFSYAADIPLRGIMAYPYSHLRAPPRMQTNYLS